MDLHILNGLMKLLLIFYAVICYQGYKGMSAY